ncbi:hypothetical protein B0H13DRAFT_1888289 [Mycena leptocephala]|nr:hypothetical protein B0H13DRAFT_1888289 [Mycena leptocephala]
MALQADTLQEWDESIITSRLLVKDLASVEGKISEMKSFEASQLFQEFDECVRRTLGPKWSLGCIPADAQGFQAKKREELEENFDSQFYGKSREQGATFRGVHYGGDLSSIPVKTDLLGARQERRDWRRWIKKISVGECGIVMGCELWTLRKRVHNEKARERIARRRAALKASPPQEQEDAAARAREHQQTHRQKNKLLLSEAGRRDRNNPLQALQGQIRCHGIP